MKGKFSREFSFQKAEFYAEEKHEWKKLDNEDVCKEEQTKLALEKEERLARYVLKLKYKNN